MNDLKWLLGNKYYWVKIKYYRTYARVTENEPQRAQRSRMNESLRGFLRKSYISN